MAYDFQFYSNFCCSSLFCYFFIIYNSSRCFPVSMQVLLLFGIFCLLGILICVRGE